MTGAHRVVVGLDEVAMWKWLTHSLVHGTNECPIMLVPGTPFPWSLGKTFIFFQPQFSLSENSIAILMLPIA